MGGLGVARTFVPFMWGSLRLAPIILLYHNFTWHVFISAEDDIFHPRPVYNCRQCPRFFLPLEPLYACANGGGFRDEGLATL